MSFVGNLSLFAAAKEFCKSINIDKVIAMVRVAHFFDSRCSYSQSVGTTLQVLKLPLVQTKTVKVIFYPQSVHC